jgi:hypothetical protein
MLKLGLGLRSATNPTGDAAVIALVLKAAFNLIRVEFYLSRGNFADLLRMVRDYPRSNRPPNAHTIERICYAVDTACIWYWKRTLCLQRSVVAVRLLRSCGFPAQLVIGAQGVPFCSHAWAEVNGVVVNDRKSTTEMYTVLERC